MSIESAKKFYDHIPNDDALKAKLEAASKEDRPQILKDAGFEFTKEEMKEVAASKTELSAEDLENITGGSTKGWVKVGVEVASSIASAF